MLTASDHKQKCAPHSVERYWYQGPDQGASRANCRGRTDLTSLFSSVFMDFHDFGASHGLLIVLKL